MKLLLFASLLLVGFSLHGQEPRRSGFDETSRFIFYSVLEGLYEDGLSNEDVDQILMRKEGQSYFHFIYACPVCNATIWALETYRNRPAQFYSLKSPSSTLGPGLDVKLKAELYNEDPKLRLTAINGLVRKWISSRMDNTKLSDEERKILEEGLEKKREEGMNVLKSFRSLQHGDKATVSNMAPAYVDLEECAVCNGAVGKLMKLPGDK